VAARSALLRHGVLLWLMMMPVGCAQSLPQTRLVGVVQAGQKAGAEGVEIIRRGVPMKASERMALESGDEVRTNAVSAVIQFQDTTWVIVEPNTIVRISSLSLVRGTILAKARGLFQVQTQFVRVSVEGTEYQVSVDENNQTSVDVADGSTRLTSTTGSWDAVVVLGREGAFVKAQEVPRKRPLTPEEVARIRQQFRTFEALFTSTLMLQGTPGLGPGLR
jgi:FecR-like protein